MEILLPRHGFFFSAWKFIFSAWKFIFSAWKNLNNQLKKIGNLRSNILCLPWISCETTPRRLCETLRLCVRNICTQIAQKHTEFSLQFFRQKNMFLFSRKVAKGAEQYVLMFFYITKSQTTEIQMFENYYFYTHFGNPNSILLSKIDFTQSRKECGALCPFVLLSKIAAPSAWDHNTPHGILCLPWISCEITSRWWRRSEFHL